MKAGELRVSHVYLGSRESAWKRYIDHELRYMGSIDTRYLFVTYVGLTQADLEQIKAEIAKYAEFDSVIFQKASPVIAVNCETGTFGLLYMRKR